MAFGLASGTRNLVENVYAHDTAQAARSRKRGQLAHRRRPVHQLRARTSVTGGGATDNHGIMVYSIGATPVKNCSARGARGIVGLPQRHHDLFGQPWHAGRRGHSDNMVDSCGVTPLSGGGIYQLANAVATTDQDSVTLTGNVCWSNYVNFGIANYKRVAGGGNVSRNSVA